jgi:hypothetical protein
MSKTNTSVRRLCVRIGGAVLFSLGLAAVASGRASAQGAAESAPAKTAEKGSVKDNIKQLGREISDPNTPKRIKGHEQEAEKKVERRRDAQRKDHGTARPGDAVDLAKNVDKPDSTPVTPPPADSKTGAKKKVETTPPPPAATKPAPAPKP